MCIRDRGETVVLVEENELPRILLGRYYGKEFFRFMFTTYTLRSAFFHTPSQRLQSHGHGRTCMPSRVSLGLPERYGYVFIFTCVATDLFSQLRQLMPKTATLMRVSIKDKGISFDTNQVDA